MTTELDVFEVETNQKRNYVTVGFNKAGMVYSLGATYHDMNSGWMGRPFWTAKSETLHHDGCELKLAVGTYKFVNNINGEENATYLFVSECDKRNSSSGCNVAIIPSKEMPIYCSGDIEYGIREEEAIYKMRVLFDKLNEWCRKSEWNSLLCEYRSDSIDIEDNSEDEDDIYSDFDVEEIMCPPSLKCTAHIKNNSVVDKQIEHPFSDDDEQIAELCVRLKENPELWETILEMSMQTRANFDNDEFHVVMRFKGPNLLINFDDADDGCFIVSVTFEYL